MESEYVNLLSNEKKSSIDNFIKFHKKVKFKNKNKNLI